jgi:hypothetical protein
MVEMKMVKFPDVSTFEMHGPCLLLIHETCMAQNIKMDRDFSLLDYSDAVQNSSIPILEKGSRKPLINGLETVYNLVRSTGIKNITK